MRIGQEAMFGIEHRYGVCRGKIRLHLVSAPAEKALHPRSTRAVGATALSQTKPYRGM
jgi:hypothetical protein